MSNTEILWIFMPDYEEGWGIRRHSQDCYQMYYITDGQGEMSIGAERISLVEDLFVIIRPGVEHELFEVEKGTLRMVETKFHIHDEELKTAISTAPCVQKVEHGKISALLTMIRAEWKSPLPYKEHMCGLLFTQVLYEFLRVDARCQHIRQIISHQMPHTEALAKLPRQVAEYVQEHCFSIFSLESMAQEMNYTKNYLCKIFKNSAGCTIIEYANQLRVAKAVDLICYSNTTLNEISEISGFHDIHYFTKVFKRITGYTPGDLRNRERLNLYTDNLTHNQFSHRFYNNRKKAKSRLGVKKTGPKKQSPL